MQRILHILQLVHHIILIILHILQLVYRFILIITQCKKLMDIEKNLYLSFLTVYVYTYTIYV